MTYKAGLGTASTKDVGTSANNIVQLDSNAKLPAVDGSLLDNLPVTSVNTLTGAVVLSGNDVLADHTSTNYTSANNNVDGHLSGIDTKFGTLGTASTQNVGTSANNVVQLDGSSKLPAVDGSQLTNLPGGGATSLTGLSDVDINSSLVHVEGTTLTYSSGSEYLADYENIGWVVPTAYDYPMLLIQPTYTYGEAYYIHKTIQKANNYVLRMTGGHGSVQRADIKLPDIATSIANGNNLLGCTFTITHRSAQSQNRSFVGSATSQTPTQSFDSELFTQNVQLYRGQTLQLEVVQVGSAYKYKVLFIGVTPLDDFKRLRLLQFPSLYVSYNALPETYMNIQNVMIHVASGTMTLPTQSQSSSLYEHHVAFYRVLGTITLTIPAGVSFIDTTGTTTAGSSTVTLAAGKVHRIVSRTYSTIWNAIE